MEFDPDSWPACWVLGMIARDGDAHEFYVSPQWRAKRREVLRDQHGECWACKRKSPPVLTTAKDATLTVHHLLELRQRPDLALSAFTPDGKPNLVVLCESCHWDMHHNRRPPLEPERW